MRPAILGAVTKVLHPGLCAMPNGRLVCAMCKGRLCVIPNGGA